MGQVSEGCLIGPMGFSEGGPVPFSLCSAEAAFRLGVSHGEKLRECADLRRIMLILRAAVLTPTALPARCHLAQMTKSIHTTRTGRFFLKGDRASAYKQLPLDPKYATLTAVSLRRPLSGRWMGFIPKALPFGAAAAVIHYNCYSRSLAVIISRYLDIPLIS